MAEINRAVKGTNDILPSEVYKWQFVENRMLETARMFGFEEIRVPFSFSGMKRLSVTMAAASVCSRLCAWRSCGSVQMPASMT